ncbi:UDP-glycosyltransferase UGT5-like isoform X1 [Neodiprion fabricii]|uniref:UDP-glycosyltransferase UGT5-like isoform X1 n=1 Tax=Neodiprion fabricii TaxID=2872261 RepID=UPI001ED917EC|nr:UDP-glycosyltransferase UGT5-like isoform X1 [Neodiprion fabricii]
MLSRYFVSTILTLAVVGPLNYGNCARILGVFPTPSFSHQVVFRGLTLELNKRGHELVIVTTDPVNDPSLKNYTEIDIGFMYEMHERFGRNMIEYRRSPPSLTQMSTLSSYMNLGTEKILTYPELRRLYERDSDEKFDLVIMEQLFSFALLPLADRFDAPMIGISSLVLSTNTQYGIGNTIIPSHPANWELQENINNPLTFWQRLKNFCKIWSTIYVFRTYFMPGQEEIARKYFGDDIPSLYEIEKNISLIFVNQVGPISYAKPNVPKIIEINGFHISKHKKPLPQDLQNVLDRATQGFVYMSLGTNVKSITLSAETRSEFVAAFSKLPFKVIWKFEDDNFPDKPDNVMILKWAPQQAILAHPNLKVFIYQGGLQSTEEAIQHAVPLVGFPVIGDQDAIVNKMVSLGVARKLEITAVNRDDLEEAILTVALDDEYKKKMLDLRSLLKDKPRDSLENAVWWTEHVIRHRGAPYLQSATADEPWYQRQDMDIVAFLSATSVITFVTILLISYKSLIFTINALTYSPLDKAKRN